MQKSKVKSQNFASSQKPVARSSQRGQSLLEVIVALVIGLLVISAFVSLGVVSVRNASISKNYANATQLAQEGIEAVIQIRDLNTVGAVRGMADPAIDQWAELVGQSLGTCSGSVEPTPSCPDGDFRLCALGSQRCLEKNAAGETLGILTRKIRITDSSSNIKNVTSIVSWTDSQGSHKSVISRRIGKDRL